MDVGRRPRQTVPHPLVRLEGIVASEIVPTRALVPARNAPRIGRGPRRAKRCRFRCRFWCHTPLFRETAPGTDARKPLKDRLVVPGSRDGAPALRRSPAADAVGIAVDAGVVRRAVVPCGLRHVGHEARGFAARHIRRVQVGGNGRVGIGRHLMHGARVAC